MVQDARLIEAVNLHKASGWTKVAEHVGGGVTRLQCHHRWSNHLKPLQQGLKRGGDWTEAEVCYYKLLHNSYNNLIPSSVSSAA